MHLCGVSRTIPILPADLHDAPQRVVKVRRDYNAWVASETLEDYALRFTPRTFRKWSEFRVANTAFGATSFLALEAIGGAIAINYGFSNALWAILIVGLIWAALRGRVRYPGLRFGRCLERGLLPAVQEGLQRVHRRRPGAVSVRRALPARREPDSARLAHGGEGVR